MRKRLLWITVIMSFFALGGCRFFYRPVDWPQMRADELTVPKSEPDAASVTSSTETVVTETQTTTGQKTDKADRKAEKSSDEAVWKAAEGFYPAMNSMFAGDIGPIKAMWSQASDITYMGPYGTMQVGRPAVDAALEQEAEMKKGRKISPDEIEIGLKGDTLAYAWCVEQEEKTDEGGVVVKTKKRATNIFRLEDGDWKLIHRHTTVIENTKKPEDPNAKN